jgi:hypothetical protein
VLLNRLSVNEDGRLVLPDGMSYRVLVLPEIDRMTPPCCARSTTWWRAARRWWGRSR